MTIEVTTRPDVETTTLDLWLLQLKRDLRITTSADDQLLIDLLADSYAWAEDYLKRSLLTQTLAVQFDAGEARSPLYLPRSPVQSITSVKTYDDDGTETTTANTEYRLEGTTGATTYVDGAYLVIEGGGWEIDRSINAVKVTYVAGYCNADADPITIPRAIQRGLIRQAATMWHFRVDVPEVGTGGGAVPGSAAADLLWPYMLGRV